LQVETCSIYIYNGNLACGIKLMVMVIKIERKNKNKNKQTMQQNYLLCSLENVKSITIFTTTSL
jgi:hypothetical protein